MVKSRKAQKKQAFSSCALCADVVRFVAKKHLFLTSVFAISVVGPVMADTLVEVPANQFPNASIGEYMQPNRKYLNSAIAKNMDGVTEGVVRAIAMYSGTAQYTCNPGWFLPAGSTDCARCRPNYYCPGGDYPSVADADMGIEACNVLFTKTGSESCTVANGTGGSRAYSQTCYRKTSPEGSVSSAACTGEDCGAKVYDSCYVGLCNTGYHKNQETNATSCELDEYTIKFNLDGGTNYTGAPTSYTIETSTITLGTPTKQGYTFGGWYDNSGLTGTAVTQIAKGTTGNKEYWAKWTIASYKCEGGQYLPVGLTACMPCLENNYCTGGTYPYSATQDQGLNACNVSFTNSGTESCSIAHAASATKSYTQTCYHKTSPAGSTLSSECTGVADCDTRVYGVCYVSSCDDGYHKNQETNATSCVADTYTIKYNLDSGTNFENAPTSYTIETNTITLGTPTKKGYTFGGWYDNSWFVGTAVTQITKGSTGNKEYWAKWNAASYACDAGQFLPAGETLCSACAENNYCTGGIYTYSTTQDQGIEACLVSFANSGTESCSISHAISATKSYTQTCYHKTSAAGSTSSSACTGTADCGTKTYGTCYVGTCETGYHKNQETDATSCVADTYTIKFNLNGGTNYTGAPTSYTIETSTITLGAPTKSGYEFGGWYDNSGLTGTAVTKITKGTTGNKEYWAKWTIASYGSILAKEFYNMCTMS